MKIETYKIIVYGKVQGVWFRKWIFDHAIRLNLTGYAKNLKRYDEVEIVIQGNIKNLKKMIEISKIGPELANVIRIEFSKIFNQKKYTNFDIK